MPSELPRQVIPDFAGYELIVVPYREPRAGGDWLVRVYDTTGQHIHSAEGGVSLEVGLREAQRAILDDQQRRIAEAQSVVL